MKKIYTLMTLVACTMMFAGCQKDSLIFDAEIENYASDSKVYIDANNYACWNHGDPITINNTSANVMISDVDKTASVSVETTDLPTKDITGFTAVYPSNVVTDCSNGHVSMAVPQTQEYKVIRGAQVISAPMVAYAASSSDPLKFRNTGSILAVTVPFNAEVGAMEISEIKVTSDQSALSGRATINANDPENPVMTVTGSKEVKLTFPKDPSNLDPNYNKILSGSKTFYIAIPQITNTRLYMEVLYSGTKNGVKSFYRFQSTLSNTLTIARNKIVPISIDYSKGNNKSGVEVLYGSGTKNDAYRILSLNDLLLLASLENIPTGTYFSQRVELTLPADFPGIGSVSNPFKAAYRGVNRQIINNSNSSLFNVLGEGADIQDVKIKNNINVSGANDRGGLVNVVKGDGVNIINCEVSGSMNVSNATTAYAVGGIIGVNECSNLLVKKCTNKMNIGCSGKLSMVGGIVGLSKGTESHVLYCNNEGSVKGGIVGGIVGETNETTILINRSINTGILSSLKETGTYIGGVLGNNENNLKKVEVINCVNHAFLDSDAEYVGGVVGNNAGTLVIENSYADGIFNGKRHDFSITQAGLISRSATTASTTILNSYAGFRSTLNFDMYWIIGEGDASCTNVHRATIGGLDTMKDKPGVKNMDGVTMFTDHSTLVGELNAYTAREGWKLLNNYAALNFEN